MTDPIVHLVLAVDRRVVSVYAAGSALVRAACPTAASAGPHGAMAEFAPDAAADLVDAMAAASGHYPVDPSLDTQRAAIRAAAAELRHLRDDADEDANTAAAVDRALRRHVGEGLRDAAYMIVQCRNHMGERTVAEMAAELAGLIHAIGPIPITNQDDRIARHMDRIRELCLQLPQPGETPTP